MKQRLVVLAHAKEHGLKLAVRHFALSRTTVRGWRERHHAHALRPEAPRRWRPTRAPAASRSAERGEGPLQASEERVCSGEQLPFCRRQALAQSKDGLYGSRIERLRTPQPREEPEPRAPSSSRPLRPVSKLMVGQCYPVTPLPTYRRLTDTATVLLRHCKARDPVPRVPLRIFDVPLLHACGCTGHRFSASCGPSTASADPAAFRLCEAVSHVNA